MPGPSRRAALGLMLAAAPVAALAIPSGRIVVDVSTLRRRGDNTDADHFAQTLPGYLLEAFGPGHDVFVRILDVTYGAPGGGGQSFADGAVDTIEGVARVDGREVPLICTVQAIVRFPDFDGYFARRRQDQLARSFAHWLPGQAGIWR